MKITFISDTHTKHKQVTSSLPGGDLLIHAGDLSSMGYKHEVQQFCKWFNSIEGYNHKAFIAGNHDFWFEKAFDIDKKYKDKGVVYLFDHFVNIDGLNIYGSPWQPAFFNWAFNLHTSKDLKYYWDKIPNNLDVLITHGPPKYTLDVLPTGVNVGCEELTKSVALVKPKIHCFGHIHSGYGEKYVDGVQYFNAAVLGENYNLMNNPINIEYDKESKEIIFI
jgi:Icc-related predicted phosphoesterase